MWVSYQVGVWVQKEVVAKAAEKIQTEKLPFGLRVLEVVTVLRGYVRGETGQKPDVGA